MELRAMTKAVPAAPQFAQENSQRIPPLHARTPNFGGGQRDQADQSLKGSGVPVEKVFVVNGQNFYYHNS